MRLASRKIAITRSGLAMRFQQAVKESPEKKTGDRVPGIRVVRVWYDQGGMTGDFSVTSLGADEENPEQLNIIRLQKAVWAASNSSTFQRHCWIVGDIGMSSRSTASAR
jgi:hypothetical protein